MSSAPSFASFFSGVGGFDWGFREAGFRGVAAIDNYEPVLRMHADNFEGIPTHLVDLAVAGPPPGLVEGADVFVMGPPCQGFSTMAGDRFEDKRNDLLLESARLVSRYLPSVAVIENVPGANNTRHHAKWVSTLEILKQAAYRVEVLRLVAADFGVPQTRKRNVIIAWRTAASRVPDMVPREAVTVSKALANVETIQGHDPVELDPRSRIGKIARGVGAGQRLSNAREGDRYVHTWEIPDVFGTTTAKEKELLSLLLRLRRRCRQRTWGDADPVSAEHLEASLGWDPTRAVVALKLKGYLRDRGDGLDLTHTFNGKHVRPPLAGLSPTIDTRVLDPHYFLHPTANRPLTIREAARLQTFPDDFVIRGALRDVQRAIGNAVPPRLAHAVASSVFELVTHG